MHTRPNNSTNTGHRSAEGIPPTRSAAATDTAAGISALTGNAAEPGPRGPLCFPKLNIQAAEREQLNRADTRNERILLSAGPLTHFWDIAWQSYRSTVIPLLITDAEVKEQGCYMNYRQSKGNKVFRGFLSFILVA